MSIYKHSTKYTYWLIIFLFFICSRGISFCQDSPSDRDTLATASIPFALSEIPNEFSILSNRLIEISEVIQPKEQIANNDLVVREYITGSQQAGNSDNASFDDVPEIGKSHQGMA